MLSRSGDDGWSGGKLLEERLTKLSSETNISTTDRRRRSEPFAFPPFQLPRHHGHGSPKKASSSIVEPTTIHDQETSAVTGLVPTYKHPSKHPPNHEAVPNALMPDALSTSGIETQEHAPKTTLPISPTASNSNLVDLNSHSVRNLEISSRLNDTEHEPHMTEAQATTPKGPGNAPISAYGSPQTELVSSSLPTQIGNIFHKAPMETSTSHVGFQAPDPQMTAPVDKLWPQLKRRRMDNWTLKSEIHRIQAKLRNMQQAKSKADDALIRRMTEIKLLGQGTEEKHLLAGEKSVEDLMHHCQTIRDDYGPLEDDCNRLEDQLSSDEFRQNILEEKLYEHLEQYFSRSSAGTPPSQNSVTIPPTEETLETPEFHPLVREFLSRLGDLYLLIEECDELVDDENSMIEAKSTRARVGLPLSAEDQNFLEHFESTESKLTKKINDTQIEVERMRKDCLERRLIDENDEPTDFVTQEKLHFQEEEDLNPQENTSEYVKYPLLLPRQGIRDGVDKSKVEKAFESKSDDNANRINQWLLRNMLGSPLEVMLLASTFEWVKGGKTNDQWEYCVLYFWSRDIPMMRGANVRSSSLTTHADPGSEDSEHYHF